MTTGFAWFLSILLVVISGFFGVALIMDDRSEDHRGRVQDSLGWALIIVAALFGVPMLVKLWALVVLG
jgi:H+/Cl- antiporter ClcA